MQQLELDLGPGPITPKENLKGKLIAAMNEHLRKYNTDPEYRAACQKKERETVASIKAMQEEQEKRARQQRWGNGNYWL